MNGALDFARAGQEAERALALAPGNEGYADYGYRMGRFDAAITAARRAVVLDPLNPGTHSGLAAALLYARHSPSSQSVTISPRDARHGGPAIPLEEFLDLWKPEQRGSSHDRTLIAWPW
jgi:tetratricopeptide (TPR) repeat protein